MTGATIGIFPLFLSEDNPVWNLATVAPLLEHLLRKTAPLFDRCYVVSNHPGAASLLPGGCEFVTAEEDGHLPQDLLPSGCLSAWEAVRDRIDDEDRVVILDKAYPLLDAVTISAALDAFDKSGRDVLFPITECEYHPCTLRTRLNLLENGLIPLLGAPDENGLRLSEPFPWRWPADLVPTSEGQALEAVYDPVAGRIGYAPVPDRATVLTAFIREGENHARLLAAEPIWGTMDTLGVAVAPSRNDERATLSKRDDCLCLYIPALAETNAREALCHLFAGTKLMELACETGGRGVILPDLPDLAGLVGYQAYAMAEQGPSDLGAKFPPDPELWSVSQRGLLVRLPERTVIHGRQAFPEVYERCSALLVLRQGAMETGRLRRPDGAGFCLVDRRRMFRLNTPLDLLRLNIGLKNRAEWLT